MADRQRPPNVVDLPTPAPKPLDWEALEEHGEPPPRKWALDYWLGMGHVTLLSGSGGLGKSILSQQLLTAIALGKPFISTVPEPRRALGWMGEDDEAELWRRQIAICKKFDVPLSSLRGRLDLYAMDRNECCLLDLMEGKTVRTSLLKDLREQIGDIKAGIVLLDNISRLFGCNENDRHHVSNFYSALQWAASPTGAAVELVGHVAKIQNSEFSGSTAWENAARGRLWLTDKPPDKKPDPDAGDAEPLDLRYLAKRKVNYSSRDLAILRYADGAYDVIEHPKGGGIVASIDRARAGGVVMRALSKLIELNFTTSDDWHSHQFLPRLIIEHSLAEGFTKRDLTDAMHLAVTDGEIVRTMVKQANRSGEKVRLVPKQIV